MIASLRNVLLALTVGILVAGAILASVIINSTSGGSGPSPNSPAAIAVATRSLPRYWVVGPGETFTSIAAKNHLSVSQLQQLNPAQDPSALLPGKHLRLHLPTRRPHAPRRLPPRFWIVHAGQTYSSIAATTRVPVANIAQLNPSVNPKALRLGQRLRLRP